jgi:hypothetical protein
MISGGEVTVNCRHFGIVGTNGVSITGGRVTVTGYTGVYAGSGDITLGYTSAGDSITASSYSAENGAVTVSENKCFITDGDAPAVIPSGTVSDLTAIEGKTLSPALAVRIANDIENGTVAASGSELNGVKYNAYGASVTLTVEPAEGYRLDALTVTDANGNAVETTAGENNTYTFTMPAGNVTAAATFVPEQSEPPAFGTPTFTMPAALTTIEESAFEGMTNMTVVDAHSVTSVGKDAFRGCTGLTQIRLAKDCDIDPYAFTGCGTVYVYAPAGGTTQAYCTQETNPCVFVEETDETLSSFTDPSGTVYTFPSGSNLPSIPVLP